MIRRATFVTLCLTLAACGGEGVITPDPTRTPCDKALQATVAAHGTTLQFETGTDPLTGISFTVLHYPATSSQPAFDVTLQWGGAVAGCKVTVRP